MSSHNTNKMAVLKPWMRHTYHLLHESNIACKFQHLLDTHDALLSFPLDGNVKPCTACFMGAILCASAHPHSFEGKYRRYKSTYSRIRLCTRKPTVACPIFQLIDPLSLLSSQSQAIYGPNKAPYHITEASNPSRRDGSNTPSTVVHILYQRPSYTGWKCPFK